MSCPITISDSAAIFLLAERMAGPHTKNAVLSLVTRFEVTEDKDAGIEITKSEFDMLFVEPFEIPETYKIYKDSFIHIALDQAGAEQLVGSQLITENGQVAFRHWDFDTTGIQEIIQYN